MQVRIVSEPPPPRIYEACKEKFGADFENTVFTHGETIHSKYPIPQHLVEHERKHASQQCIYGIVAWWDRYLEDDQFRFEQELEAYQEQYKWIKKNIKNRNDAFNLLRSLAKDLSGPLYGNLCSYQSALTKIKNG